MKSLPTPALAQMYAEDDARGVDPFAAPPVRGERPRQPAPAFHIPPWDDPADSSFRPEPKPAPELEPEASLQSQPARKQRKPKPAGATPNLDKARAWLHGEDAP